MKTTSWNVRKLILQFCVLALAVMCCGNESCIPEDPTELELDPETLMEDTRPVEGVVSVHRIIKYRRGEDTEKIVKSYFEDDVCLEKKTQIDSSEIKSIEAVKIPDDTMYNLKLNLSEKGCKYWIALSIGNKGQNLAFVIDGMMYRRFVPRLIYDDTTSTVIVDGPFDKETAEKIAKNSRRNHWKLSH